MSRFKISLDTLNPQLRKDVLDLLESLIANRKVSDVNQVQDTTLSDNLLRSSGTELEHVDCLSDIACEHQATEEIIDGKENRFENFLKKHPEFEKIKGALNIFTWNPKSQHDLYNNNWIVELIVREEGFSLNDDTFRKFVLNLILMYEHAAEGNYDDALKRAKNAREIVKNSEDFTRYREGILYILNVSFLHVLCRKGCIVGARYLLKQLVLFEDLSQSDKAIVLLHQAVIFLEYGELLEEQAVRIIREAISLDPHMAEGYYWLGKCLKYYRKDDYYEWSFQEEIEAFEKAAQISNRAFYKAHLADSYWCLSRYMYYNKIRSGTITKYTSYELNERACKLSIEAAETDVLCPFTNARCAKILWSIPKPYRDPERAKVYILRALELAPGDTMVVHMVGLYYEYCEKDKLQALHYYKKAGDMSNDFAYFNYVDLLFKMRRYDEIEKALDDMYARFPYSRIRVLITRGFYFDSVKGSFSDALKAWREGIELNPKSPVLQRWTNYFTKGREPVNVYSHAITKLLVSITEEKDEERKAFLKEYLEFFQKYLIASS